MKFLVDLSAPFALPASFMLVFVLVVSGFGALIWPNRSATPIDFGVRAIVGMLTLTACGLVFNTFVPLGPGFAIGTTILGVGICLLKRRQIIGSLGRQATVLLMVMVTMLPVLGLDAVMGGIAADTGLYHLPMIKWVEESNRVLGLANLHSRFGFNSSFFSFAALFDWPHTGRGALFALTEAIILVTTLSMAEPVLARPFSDVILRPSSLYATCLAASAFYLSICTPFSGTTSSPAYDPPTAILSCYGIWAFLAWGESFGKQEHERSRTALRGLVAATTLAATFKLSAATIILLPAIAVSLEIRRDRSQWKTLARDPINWMAAVAITAWLVAGIMLSGCLIFPSPSQSTCIVGLPWSVPGKIVTELSDIIKAWARSPGENYDASIRDSVWLQDWAIRQWRDYAVRHEVYVLLIAIGLWLPLIGFRRTVIGNWTGRPLGLPIFAIALLVVLISFVFWFISAPDPRFAQALFVGLPCLIAAAALKQWAVFKSARLLFRLLPLAIGIWFYHQAYIAYPVYWLMARQVEKWPVILQPEFSEIETGPPPSILVRYTDDQCCWDLARPCAPQNQWSPGLHEEPPIAMWRVYAARRDPKP